MWVDRVRRDAFMKASFKRAFQTLQPHALLVLGDVSDWGRKSSKEEWQSVVRRFKDIAMPLLSLPHHVLPGNHDIGDYYQITPTLLQHFVDTFPSLDNTGSRAFTIRNISFVSLNAMALACDECPSYNSMKMTVEQLKAALQTDTDDAFDRPVLLTHLPVHREDESVCDLVDVPKCAPWHEVEGGCESLFQSSKVSRYHKLTPFRNRIDMLSLNTSSYLLSALKPRLVLSAHAHRFCSRIVGDGVREITVSTFTWRNRDDPGFLLVHFYKDGTWDIQQCFLPRESFVLGMHVLQGTVLFALTIFGGLRYRRLHKGARMHLKT